MITVYKHIEEELVSDCTVSDATKGSWVNLVNPDPDELSLINILTEIPTDVLKTALDMEERSHVELEDNYIFVVINIPLIRGNDMYDTVPLGIFLTPDFFITVCLEGSLKCCIRSFQIRFLRSIRIKDAVSCSKSCTAQLHCSCVTCNKSTAVLTILKFNCVILQRIKTSSNCWNYRNP